MLGLASYFGHLLSCLELARRKGHKLITVATGQAVGGAFLCYGMFADRIYALDTASVGLMPIAAMSAVTKIPAPVLEKLSKTMPSLEFGAAPFALLGGVEEVWSANDDVEAKLAAAIAASSTEDNRARTRQEAWRPASSPSTFERRSSPNRRDEAPPAAYSGLAFAGSRRGDCGRSRPGVPMA